MENIPKESNNISAAAPVAYFYCTRNAAEPQRAEPEEILRSILKQLSCSELELPIREPVVQEYMKRRREADLDGSEPENLNVAETVKLIISIIEDNPATIVIDALDECQPERRRDLLTALDDIIKTVASRPTKN